MGEQVLLGPLYRWLEATFGSSYQEATGRTLVAEEVRQLVRFLGARQSDAVLFLMAINRYAAQVKGHDNTASRLHRVRAFADLLLIFESSLRKWQSLPASPRANLCRRVQELLRPSLVASAELNRRLQQYPGADWEDTLVLDEVVRQELARFSEVSVRAEKAAIAVFTSYRLRNSVMHVVDDQLQLFSAPEILEQVMGLALIAIRASSYGADDAIDEL
ncbi:MAG: hypothetical protein KJN97_17850 [Deltaproteobacteria bacterium]|nr:hypothetical protein [Deltaproteobacteria bacterium]